METVDVVIATYGDKDVWDVLAQRAERSAEDQTIRPDAIWRTHGPNLAHARNVGAHESTADWLIFLDADDELDPYYIEAMLLGTGDIRQPMTLGVTDGQEDDFPVLIPPHPAGFMVGNHLIIGCMVRRELFMAAGGFADLPVLEDWDLWIRCRLSGGEVGQAPKAIYRVHVRSESRNTEANGHHQYYAQIQQAYIGAWNERGLV
jgi:glycosyltransferase involved in cell wall biosynthesis